RRRRSPGTRWPWEMPIPGATRLGLGGATSGRPGLEGSGRACARLRAASQGSPLSIFGCASAADAPASARVLCRPSRTPPDPYTEKTRPAAGPRPVPARDLTPPTPSGYTQPPAARPPASPSGGCGAGGIGSRAHSWGGSDLARGGPLLPASLAPRRDSPGTVVPGPGAWPAPGATWLHSRAGARCLVQHRTVEHFAAHAAGAVRSSARAAAPPAGSPARRTVALVSSSSLRTRPANWPPRRRADRDGHAGQQEVGAGAQRAAPFGTAPPAILCAPVRQK